MDEAELDRIDMCHTKYCALIGKTRYLAPVNSPQRILDLGCGTGSYHLGQRDRIINIDSRYMVHRDG